MQFTDKSRLEKLKEDIDTINQLLEKVIDDIGWLENADAENEIKDQLTDAKETIESAFSDCEDEIDKIENPDNWTEDDESENEL